MSFFLHRMKLVHFPSPKNAGDPMIKIPSLRTPPRLVLRAQVARDVMSSELVSLEADATLFEAIELFVDRGIRAAPVIDAAGRPIGVLARVDILAYERAFRSRFDDNPVAETFMRGLDRVRVADIMSPVVYTISPETPIEEVLEEMRQLKVHHLFVQDSQGVVLGSVSALDIIDQIVLD